MLQSIFLLLSHPNGEEGILLANKSPFSEEESKIESLLKSAQLREISKNDIFGSYDIEINAKLNRMSVRNNIIVFIVLVLKAQLIYPANDRLIAKYRQEEKYVINETPHLYETVTKQYIEKYQLNLNVSFLIKICSYYFSVGL